jgi:hypothetical protein
MELCCTDSLDCHSPLSAKSEAEAVKRVNVVKELFKNRVLSLIVLINLFPFKFYSFFIDGINSKY